MPERSFGRTVRYRRTKLGLSQAKLGELVGRSASTIRSWERDNTRPADAKVVSALAAILAVDARQLFEKAGVKMPEVETSPTVEQALATLTPIVPAHVVEETSSEPDPEAEPEPPPEASSEPESPAEPPRITSAAPDAPAYVAPADPFVVTRVTPAIADPSYMEDQSQRQLYRVRTLATMVVVVALVVAFIWAFGEGWGAITDWWDGFFGNLRL